MNLINTIVSMGDTVGKDIYMVECGCAVNNNELELCPTHEFMDHDAIIIELGGTNDVEPPAQTVVEEVAVEEDAKPLDKMTIKELLVVAESIGLSFKAGTRKPVIYKAIVAKLAEEDVVEPIVEEPVAEPVAIDVDYGKAVAGFAEELIALTYSDRTPNQVKNMVRLNAAAILRLQQDNGTELTQNQKDAMTHHKLSESGLNSMLRTVDMTELRNMDGIQVFTLAIKLGMKPNLADITPLHNELILLCDIAHAKASEASRANEVSTTPHTFKSARPVKIFNNAVQFVADGIEYAFVITKEGKHVLRHIAKQHSNYMTAKYLKKMLFEINTRDSRSVVKAITSLENNYSPVGGGTPKEKNSTAKKEQDVMVLSHKGSKHTISKAWYQQFVNHAKQSGHTGSFPVGMILEAWNARG